MSDIDPARLMAAHREAVGFYRHHLLADERAQHYLQRRGFGVLAQADLPWHASVDRPWRVGYAPAAWTTLTDRLTRLGFSSDELVAAGLTRRSPAGRLYDTFRDRIMFPIRASTGEPVGFTGRTLQTDERVPKYLNTPQTSIFHKGQTLFGLAEQADRLNAGAAPVIVEGPLDVIAVWLAHPHGTGLPRTGVAACGTNLNPEHIATLTALPGTRRHGITTCYDPDPAGAAATERAWQLLHTHRGLPLRAATLPGTDPAELVALAGGTAALREALTHRARPLLETVIDNRLHAFIDRYADRPDSPELRVAAVHTVAELLTHLTAQDSRCVVEHVADIAGVSVQAVTEAVIAALDRQHGDGIGAPQPTAQSPPGQPPATAFPPPGSAAPPALRGGHPVTTEFLRRHRPGRR